MKTPAQKPPGTGGGSVAIRGLLTQTLIALLDMVRPESSFTEITLEPAVGDEQFDFLWKDKNGSYATQVKSTINSFTKADIEKWADKLQKARKDEQCRLMLVGNIPPNLVGLNSVGVVVIETKNLHLEDLVEQAAHRLAAFLEDEKHPAGTAAERIMVVHALVSKLQRLSAASERFTREAFIKLLARWVKEAPRQDRPIDISRIDKYAPAELIGREAETKLLSDAWDKAVRAENPRPRVLTFVALGGEGKTALVAKWAAELAAGDWPGCDAAFAWSFYSQGTRDQAAASSDTFLKEALVFFGDPDMANSAAGGHEKGQRLAQLVGQRRALLILDGLEPLQYAPSSPLPGQLKDQGLAALLKGLAASNHGLCVVTTRYGIPDLRAYRLTTAPEVDLLRLSKEAGVALLKNLGVKTGSKEDFEKLVEDVKGHALTLHIIGGFLARAYHGDIRHRDRVKFEKADEKIQGSHAFRAMSAYVKWMEDGSPEAQRELTILRLIGLFDRPATADCVSALLNPPAITGLTDPLVGIAEEDWDLCLSALQDAKLLTVHRDPAGTLLALDAHPLLREYFAKDLREKNPDGWRAGHKRLYKYLCATTTDKKPQPTLEDLQPLYQAVAHGCQAGLQQEACDKVYRARIVRGKEAYAVKILGAFGSDLGAVACFFETPWTRVSHALTQADHAWLLNEAAFRLRALGRLTEALEPMRASWEMCVQQKDWKNAATDASNLSELELTLGEVTGAMADAKESVTYADRSGDVFWRCLSRVQHGNMLQQASEHDAARNLFQEAEEMQKKNQPDYPLLYSLQGFLYCDLLLAEPERAVWQVALNPKSKILNSTLMDACRAVSQRAETALKIVLNGSRNLLDIALNHLTLARAALYQTILENRSKLTPSAAEGPKTCPERSRGIENIESAVSGFRRSGDQDMLVLGLLTRAWLRYLTGVHTGPERAQSDLDEAWEIAERGPMPLHMVDIHLHRARLFFREAKYPWDKNLDGTPRGPKDDLAEARRLIEKHGYHRRDEELADAEGAILDKKKN